MTQPAPSVPDVRFLLLPLPEFTMLPFGGFLDKLRFSADEEDYSAQRYCAWRVLGLELGSIVSSSGVAIEVQEIAAQTRLTDFDYLVVFGGRTARRSMELADEYGPLLRKAAAQGLSLVSIDNACFLLAAAGLLQGAKVAMHWRHVQEFQVAFPRIEVRTGQLYCFDGKRISCAGGVAAVDLAVELLARHCGRTRALKGLADMLVDEARSETHPLKSLSRESGLGRSVGRATSLMRQWLGDAFNVDDIAAAIGVSRRQLDRLFMTEFDCTARAYWREMRLQHARWRLLNSHHSLAVLADEIGAQDVSHLCKMFRQRFGVSPDAFRKSGG
ncbi:GlxA family transcriptional regulator [Hahella sp. HN01]|uniref:GlxA family transcriptional regulator n=1 Tax=Hahella sp. HN01 TaxID=2847262 RepID=UPI001C1EC68F|nr:helix-turn-helix domain-containing protein [Hahella sp. HN01]MBU6950239.1 helix-turn-helix domain-containing protein [Hahella sp. HN01]